MPRTDITPQNATGPDGLTAVFEAANSLGNAIVPSPGRSLQVRNGSASAVTVTLQTPAQIQGLDVAEKVISVAAGATLVKGLSALPGVYVQADGKVYVDYSAVTSVTVCVIDH